jgi:hypothetical protein
MKEAWIPVVLYQDSLERKESLNDKERSIRTS